MPYIEHERRAPIWNEWRGYAETETDPEEPAGAVVVVHEISTPGELNFAITKMIKWLVDQDGESYTKYNEMIGVLQCVQLELYRRAIAVYEEEKRNENGDVFE